MVRGGRVKFRGARAFRTLVSAFRRNALSAASGVGDASLAGGTSAEVREGRMPSPALGTSALPGVCGDPLLCGDPGICSGAFSQLTMLTCTAASPLQTWVEMASVMTPPFSTM